jgi:hypothetical protein
MGHILHLIKITYFNDLWSLKINAIKMKQWSYYINVYYEYTHESFNIDNEIYYYFLKLHNISFVKIIIVRPKN